MSNFHAATAISRFARYEWSEFVMTVSSPQSQIAMNSCDTLPPIMPEFASIDSTFFMPSRRKIRT